MGLSSSYVTHAKCSPIHVFFGTASVDTSKLIISTCPFPKESDQPESVFQLLSCFFLVEFVAFPGGLVCSSKYDGGRLDGAGMIK